MVFERFAPMCFVITHENELLQNLQFKIFHANPLHRILLKYFALRRSRSMGHKVSFNNAFKITVVTYNLRGRVHELSGLMNNEVQ